MPMKLFNNKIILTDDGEIQFVDSVYWENRHFDVFGLSPGASGAQWTAPDANTLGGYQLDAATEYLYVDGDVCSDYDGESDLEVKVSFEVNVDNSGGNVGDTVDLKLVCYYKGSGDAANKTQTLEEAVVVGQSPQYKQFVATFTIDWDAADNVVEAGDKLNMVLNLETDTSEVDNIIINHIHLRYKKKKVGCEVT